jgi:lipopolysaccharide export system protein LptA
MQPVNRVLSGCISIWLLCLPLTAWSLSADRNEPINIEADRATLHEKIGRSIYRGNVHLQQGTLQLHGDTMVVQMHDDNIVTIVLTGSPATYAQRPDNATEDQHAEAGRIEYKAAEELMVLRGNARVWQSGDEEFRSERIVFNLADNTVNAGGGSAGDRVRITLQPRKSGGTEAEPVTAPAPEVAPAPAPADAAPTAVAP